MVEKQRRIKSKSQPKSYSSEQLSRLIRAATDQVPMDDKLIDRLIKKRTDIDHYKGNTIFYISKKNAHVLIPLLDIYMDKHIIDKLYAIIGVTRG